MTSLTQKHQLTMWQLSSQSKQSRYYKQFLVRQLYVSFLKKAYMLFKYSYKMHFLKFVINDICLYTISLIAVGNASICAKLF